jgi:hypothetical protein
MAQVRYRKKQPMLTKLELRRCTLDEAAIAGSWRLVWPSWPYLQTLDVRCDSVVSAFRSFYWCNSLLHAILRAQWDLDLSFEAYQVHVQAMSLLSSDNWPKLTYLSLAACIISIRHRV